MWYLKQKCCTFHSSEFIRYFFQYQCCIWGLSLCSRSCKPLSVVLQWGCLCELLLEWSVGRYCCHFFVNVESVISSFNSWWSKVWCFSYILRSQIYEGDPNKWCRRGSEHYLKSNNWGYGVEISAGVGVGNFDKIKRMGLFVNEIQF